MQKLPNASATGASLTVASVQPGAEWLRPSDVRPIFGIGRSTLYALLQEGKVRSICLRREGRLGGMRLVSAASLREFIESHSEDAK
jgi:hypothetical protein